MASTDTRTRPAGTSEAFVPQATPETQFFWDGTAAGELRVPLCRACERTFFYPRSSCPRCGSENVTWVRGSGRATLYSYVISARPAPGFEPPTVIAVVELEEGPRMMTNVVGVEPEPEALPLDLALRVVFEPRGDLAVPVFEPDPEGGAR